MPPAVTSAFRRIGSTIAGFSIAQRTIAIIGVAVLVLGAVALGSWLTRPTYTPLFTSLSASDANAIVEQLRSAGVSYELADGGATVLVPEKDVYDQRLAAASAGLPSASPGGYTLLDDMGVTTSEFQQSVTYKRAIEGELARTIGSLEGISAASVHLAIPEESVFVSEKVDPTASVFVETKTGVTLSPRQVEAIVHLASSAVSGLKPENVSVVDQKGQTLSTAGADASTGADQAAGDYEQRVTANVQRLLDSVVGAGHATVTVAAEIDRSTSQRQAETYTPATGTPPSSEHTKTNSSSGSGNGAGVLGPDNIAVPSDGADGTTQSSEITRNNVVNKSVETTNTPAGSVKRQSVSVAIDSAAAGSLDVAQLRSLVTTAAGIDTARGDAVTVDVVEFNATGADNARAALQAAKDEAEAERQAALLRSLIIAAAIAVPLLVVIIALIVRRRRRREADAEPDYVSLLDDSPRSLLATAPAAASPTVSTAILPKEPEPEPEPVQLTIEEPEHPEQLSLEYRRAELDSFSRQDPRRTAELLRGLIDVRQDA